jgi:hypothetical protein
MANRRLTPAPALYLYGVSRAAGNRPARVESPGIDGQHPVQPLACGNLVCWVSAVDRHSFSQEIERNTDNLEWLAVHGVRHQQVVAEIATKTTIVPARFGTIFSGGQALSANVEGRKSILKKVLSRISNADEWGVKVLAERQAMPKIATEVRTGKDYLRAKAAHLNRPPDRDDAMREFSAALNKIASDAAPSGKISRAQPDLLWQATFLVPRSRRKLWDRALNRFVKQWIGSRRIEVNGPWPPYSFVSDAE